MRDIDYGKINELRKEGDRLFEEVLVARLKLRDFYSSRPQGLDHAPYNAVKSKYEYDLFPITTELTQIETIISSLEDWWEQTTHYGHPTLGYWHMRLIKTETVNTIQIAYHQMIDALKERYIELVKLLEKA